MTGVVISYNGLVWCCVAWGEGSLFLLQGAGLEGQEVPKRARRMERSRPSTRESWLRSQSGVTGVWKRMLWMMCVGVPVGV